MCFKKCNKKFQGCIKNIEMKFLLQFCCMNLIAATRAEGGLVLVYYRGLPKLPRLLLMRLPYSVLCDSMQEVGSASNVSCIGSYQQPHYYYYILRRFTATVKELLLQATKYKY